ncbi:Cro/C1-type HTH DNA-binding domain [Frankia torreyi]|uniref:Cro/C1-type HTH DNA-binding domain n=1 Tax=Frankia torreyi TaxID=1856 RepID=A0A0D8BN47_9ACTN|nr:helix-turn-helix transcriptional regulator [Frankia torreyi]KJE25540.1 Cro/C1-type HTH DNA-binding domain [Frankia torreyi]
MIPKGGDVEDWSAVAKAVKERMDSTGISQKELSDRTGLSTATLRELTKLDSDRKRSSATLAKVSDALGWPTGYLLGIARHTASTEVEPANAEENALLTELRAIRDVLERIETRLSK